MTLQSLIEQLKSGKKMTPAPRQTEITELTPHESRQLKAMTASISAQADRIPPLSGPRFLTKEEVAAKVAAKQDIFSRWFPEDRGGS